MPKRSTEARLSAGADPALDLAAAARDRRLAALDRHRAAELLASAYQDELTGALARRAGRQLLTSEVTRAHRTGASLAVVFADVEGLKQANDSRGHAYGDSLLVAVTASLRNSLRDYDLVIRYGGDEFVCVLPGANVDVAVRRIHHARLKIEHAFKGATFSAGFAELQPGEGVDDVVGRADQDLYGRRTVARRTFGRPSSTDPVHHESAGHRPPVPRPDVACGQCGGRLPLETFVSTHDAHATRWADCSACGETTLIRLALPRDR